MTPEEIKKIAYDICEKKRKEIGDDPILLLSIDFYIEVVTKLSKDYCIVPRSKVKEWEEIVKDSLKADHVITEPAWRFLWERLFGKDMFEEE